MSLFRIASRLVASSNTTSFLWNRKLFHLFSALFTVFTFSMNFLESREVHRWVTPTLREIRRRRKMVGPQPEPRRSDFLDWNYDAEIYAFSVRLNEKFKIPLLQQAFVDRSYIVQEEMKQRAVGIENPVLHLTDNSRLIKKGEELMTEFIITYLNLSLPKFPRDGIKAIYKHLVSEETLAHVSSHLGTKDLILSADYPVPSKTLASNLKAVIGALFESSGDARAYEFIRDFIITQLNQKDINEFWALDNPLELLLEICKDKKLATPEPRLISDLGKNTLLAAYQVGFYSSKQLIGSGFGEDVTVATEEAAKDALRNLFKTNTNMKPFDYKMPVDIVMKSVSKPSIATVDKI
jgi:large subunit ribosomal protein L44